MKQTNTSDISISKLAIHSATGDYDLKPHFVSLNIYENLYRQSLTADITLSDSVNLPYHLALVGQETVNIDIKLTGFEEGSAIAEQEISIKPPPFHVINMNNRIYTKPKTQVFTLLLISEHYMSSLHSKVSKSYFNKTIGEMVSDIYLTYLDDRTQSEKDNGLRGLFVEPTNREERFIIPNLSPLDAIRWLSKRTEQDSGFGVNYVFFETVSRSYFCSLNYLLENQEPLMTFIYRPRVDDPSGVESLAEGVVKIESFSFMKQFDRRQIVVDGVYSSKLITHDIVTKTIEEHDYDGYAQWEEINHLGKYPPLSDSDIDTKSASVVRTSHAPPGLVDYPNDSKRMSGQHDGDVDFYPKHDNMYSQNANDEYDNYVEEWRARRKNHMGIHDAVGIVIQVKGVSSLRVGQVVKLILPSPETSEGDKKADTENDKFLTGNYMINAIQHIISAGNVNDPKISYLMNIELSKDGMEEQIAYRESRKED
jgi:hypothetical protein